MSAAPKASLRELLTKSRARLAQLPRALGLVWSADPKAAVFTVVTGLVQGLLPVALLWITRELLNQVGEMQDAKWEPSNWPVSVLSLLWALLAVVTGIRILMPISNWLRSRLSAKVALHVRDLVQTQAIHADLAFFEDPAYHDLLFRAGPESGERASQLLEQLTLVLRDLVTLGAFLVLLFHYTWWLPLALTASLVPSLCFAIKEAVEQSHWWRESTRPERFADYLHWLLIWGEGAGEQRILQSGARLRDRHLEVRRSLMEKFLSIERRQALFSITGSVISLAIGVAALMALYFHADPAEKGIGDLVLIFLVLYQSQSVSKSLFSQFGNLIRQAAQFEFFFQFLDHRPRVVSPKNPTTITPFLETEIEVENLSFSYPNSKKKALDHVSAFFPAGTMTVIVGSNGSGKSTLAKLLCRLYEPDSGQVKWDGTDFASANLDELRSRFGFLSQDPIQFQGSVRENLLLGCPDPSRATREEIERAISNAEAQDFLNPENGYGLETVLGHWFAEGIDLSTGQWRRLAIARTLLRNAPVLILDEPTSAMDTRAEASWLERFEAARKGKTVILITHRLAAARLADQILVMSDGKIVESGSHAILLERDGLYASMIEAQR